MADKLNRLSIVAQFDDIVRNRAVLTAGIETEFWTFVVNQETWRKKFLELEKSLSELSARLKEAEQEKLTLQTKLKHARNQIDHEITKRQKAEHDRDTLERQILLVRELLNDKSNATVLNEKDRERLAFLSVDYQSTLHDPSPRRNLDTIEESGSILSPSDISYDKTEEDFDTPRRPSRCKRPSAPPLDNEDDLTPPGKKSRRAAKKKHRRSRSADVQHVAPGVAHDAGTALDSISERHRHNSSPAPRVLPRSESHDEVYNSAAKRSMKKKAPSPAVELCTPDLKRFNSGNSLTKPHLFDSKTFIKQETCFVCAKKIKFGKTGMKCKACFSVCHMECKDLAPLPCSVAIVTPVGPKNGNGVISDYTPCEPPMIPALVIHCVNEIESRGLNEIGIYRVPGSEREVKELKEKFLKGRGTPNLSTVTDIHVVCGCLKDFLRSLKEPLVTYALWESFVRAAEKPDRQESQTDLYQAISQLPQSNRDTIAFMILHLQRISECAECKMPVSNLAKVFGPTVIGYSSAEPDPMRMLTETGKQTMVMEKLLSISSDYWTTFIESGMGNGQLRGSVVPNAHDAMPYRYLHKYVESGKPSYCVTPTLLGPMPGESMHPDSASQWFGSKFGSSVKKPTTPFFSSPSIK